MMLLCQHMLHKKLNKSLNKDNGIDALFLLRTGESLDGKINSFNKSLKPLLSRHRILKSLRIILMLDCGNEFLKQVLNFRFKLHDNVPRYGSTIKSSFLVAFGITFGTWSFF